jgi:hypothetical protein
MLFGTSAFAAKLSLAVLKQGVSPKNYSTQWCCQKFANDTQKFSIDIYPRNKNVD